MLTGIVDLDVEVDDSENPQPATCENMRRVFCFIDNLF